MSSTHTIEFNNPIIFLFNILFAYMCICFFSLLPVCQLFLPVVSTSASGLYQFLFVYQPFLIVFICLPVVSTRYYLFTSRFNLFLFIYKSFLLVSIRLLVVSARFLLLHVLVLVKYFLWQYYLQISWHDMRWNLHLGYSLKKLNLPMNFGILFEKTKFANELINLVTWFFLKIYSVLWISHCPLIKFIRFKFNFIAFEEVDISSKKLYTKHYFRGRVMRLQLWRYLLIPFVKGYLNISFLMLLGQETCKKIC